MMVGRGVDFLDVHISLKEVNLNSQDLNVDLANGLKEVLEPQVMPQL
jgi:hypothetical protein